jgi:hypothetical protein
MRLDSFRQTAFVTKERRVKCRLSVTDWDHCNPYYVSIHMNGKEVLPRQSNWAESMEFLLPAADMECELLLKLEPYLDTGVISRVTYHPPREWSIHFFLSSHEDLGYCAYANTLPEDCAAFLDRAMDLAEQNEGYHYVIEHTWWLSGFEKYRDEPKKKRLQQLMQDGKITLSPCHCSNHTHWQGYEQLTRAMYFGRKYAAKAWGIDPQSVIYADMGSASWGCVSAYRQAGVRSMSILGNGFLRCSKDDEKLPPVFWWQAPNGKDRILCFRQFHYKDRVISDAMGAAFVQAENGPTYHVDQSRMDSTAEEIDRLIQRFEGQPYDVVPVSFYMDREYPNLDLHRMITALAEQWEFPKLAISTPEKTFANLEQAFGEKLPVLSGDISPQWGDFAAIAPVWFGRKRRAERLYPVAETLLLRKAMIQSGVRTWPGQMLEEALWKMSEFDDHCWATSSKHPQAMHRFNLELVKKQNASVAASIVDHLLTQGIGTPTDGICSVWNTVPHTRNMHVRLPQGYVPENLPYQQMADGSALTQPLEIPAYGHINLAYQEKPQQPSYEMGSYKQQGELRFETSYYQVTCSYCMQKILSIIDLHSGEELLDQNAEHSLGEFIYVYAERKHELPISIETAKRRGMKICTGRLATEVIIESFEEQLGANVRAVFTFYENERDIDLHLSYENAAGLMGDFYDRYKKSIFFALPLRMPNHHFCTEVVGGIVDERHDRMNVNPRDFVCTQNWVSVENEERGIAVFTQEMPIFHYAGINYNQISSNVDYSRSANLYLYAASNRANSLNYIAPEECYGEFHLSLLPFSGKSGDAVSVWSYEKQYPALLGGCIGDDGSFCSLEPQNVRLLCLKKAETEDAIFMRLLEVSGKDTDAKLEFNFEVEAVCFTDAVENAAVERMPVGGKKTLLHLNAFSYANLLIYPKERLGFLMEPDDREVKNVFQYISENRDTILCFEKGGRKYQAYMIFENGKEIMRVEGDRYSIQRCTLHGKDYGVLTVKPVQSHKSGSDRETC